MDLTLAKPLKDCSVIQKNKSRFNSGARWSSRDAFRCHCRFFEQYISGSYWRRWIIRTVDELIRHSASKLSFIHFVSNEEGQKITTNGRSCFVGFTIVLRILTSCFRISLPSLDAKKVLPNRFENLLLWGVSPGNYRGNWMEQYTDTPVETY
jgi:hypothetical protein